MARTPCSEKDSLKRGPWTPEEDTKLVDYIQKNGHGNWRTLPKIAGLQRCGKSCRLRWTNYLRPDIKRGRFSAEEEETIIQLHSVLGNKWSTIAARLPGRTDNEIKNYWNTHIRKRLLRMGIDPVTHTPRMDLLDLSAILNPSGRCNPSHPLLYASLNPDLMRLAASLLCSQTHDPNLIPQNVQHTQFSDSQIDANHCTQIPHHHSSVDQQQNLPRAVPFAAGAGQGLPSCFDVGRHYQSSDFGNFGSSENSQLNAWQTPGHITREGHVVLPCHDVYGPSHEDDAIADVKPHHHHNSMFVSENSLRQGLGSANLSPSSILNSTAYINSNSVDGERESDWSMKFEIQNLMDVNFQHQSLMHP